VAHSNFLIQKRLNFSKVNADHFTVQNGRVCRVAGVQQASSTRIAPENDNKNLAKAGDSNADGKPFPLQWINGTVVEVPRKKKPERH
jgi:hypothetical protein